MTLEEFKERLQGYGEMVKGEDRAGS